MGNSIRNTFWFNLIAASILGLIFSLAYVGFIYGFFTCKDCSGVWSIFERVFIGCVEAINTFITLGYPLADEAGHTDLNLRIYVLPVFIVFSIIAFIILRRLEARKKYWNELSKKP